MSIPVIPGKDNRPVSLPAYRPPPSMSRLGGLRVPVSLVLTKTIVSFTIRFQYVYSQPRPRADRRGRERRTDQEQPSEILPVRPRRSPDARRTVPRVPTPGSSRAVILTYTENEPSSSSRRSDSDREDRVDDDKRPPYASRYPVRFFLPGNPLSVRKDKSADSL